MERLVQAQVPGELGKPERETRVWDDFGSVVLKPSGGEALAQRIRLSDTDAVAAMQLRKRDALRRVLGVKVEGEPADLGVELAPCLLGRYLAEPAVRSDVVAPDEDRVVRH